MIPAAALHLQGTAASRGLGLGRLAFLRRHELPDTRREVADPQAELERFEQARTVAKEQLGGLYESSLEKLGEKNAVLFQIHQLMLDDPEYLQDIRTMIGREHVNAEYATLLTARRLACGFESHSNDYIRGRAVDIMDISRRVIEIMLERSGQLQHRLLHADFGEQSVILAADDLAPSETVQLNLRQVAGLLTTGGTVTSHSVIFARTMDLPAVIGAGRIDPALEGCLTIIDGSSGEIIINPGESELAACRERLRAAGTAARHLEQYRGRPTLTASGRRISLFANIATPADLELALRGDAEGIGLFRSEYLFISARTWPSEEEQFAAFRQTLLAMQGRKVVIRTIDIGADKSAPYFMLPHEDNPALGMRAVRLCLSEPQLFRTHLRALYRASAFGTLAIMFPMISSVEEVRRCRAACEQVQQELTQEGLGFSPRVELGIMIETPAAALISAELAELVDFFSIGTNDLTQFTLAMDRQNARLSSRLDPCHPAVLRLIRMTIASAHEQGIWVGLCGELGPGEELLRQLIALDIDELSVVPSRILMLRAQIAAL